MKSKIFQLLFVIVSASVPVSGWSQNYIGYSKEYILKAMAANYTDMKEPVIVNDGDKNYVIFTKKDETRSVVYHFTLMPVLLEDSTQKQAEICIKYYSKNKCTSYTSCPQMDVVTRTLDSHFEKGGTYLQWIDNTRRNPQEWMLVRDDDYFEVHVMELR